jgi:aspartate aminotransferase
MKAKGKISEATDLALSEYLLNEAGVAVVPGSAFGADGYIRLSFATSNANLENALARMAKALA